MGNVNHRLKGVQVGPFRNARQPSSVSLLLLLLFPWTTKKANRKGKNMKGERVLVVVDEGEGGIKEINVIDLRSL